MKPPIKDTLKEDKPPNKGHTKSTLVHTLYKITSERGQLTSLQRTNEWVPMVSAIRRFHCMTIFSFFFFFGGGGGGGGGWLERELQ